MFFLPFLLLLSSKAINATFPDVNSFMPNILGMVPINGQFKINDQVFTFGDPNASQNADSTETRELFTQNVPEFDSQQTPTVSTPLPETSTFESRASDVLPLPPNPSQAINNSPPAPTVLPNPPVFESRLFGLPNFETRDPNFETRLPNFETREPNFESRLPEFNAFPNIGSTEIGSTFARNEKSDFIDEFSVSTPVPSGLQAPNSQFSAPTAPMNVRSNLNPTEAPIVVMPLVVSPDRLLQTESPISASNPVPIPALFASATNMNENRSSKPFQSMTGKKDESALSTGGGHDSVVLSRDTSFFMPTPTVTQIKSQTNGDSIDRTFLEQHLPPVLSSQQSSGALDTTVERPTKGLENSVIPFNFDRNLFRTQRIPTLAELDRQLALGGQGRRAQQSVTTQPPVPSN